MLTMKNPNLLNREEAAHYIGVATQTLALWSAKGRYSIPMIKVGRLSKYLKTDLDKWLESRREVTE